MRDYEPGDRTVCTSVGCGRDIEMQDTLMWVHVGSALSTCDVRYATPPQGLERELREFFDQRFAEGMTVKTDADLEMEASIWEKYGEPRMAQVLRDAIGSQPLAYEPPGPFHPFSGRGDRS